MVLFALLASASDLPAAAFASPGPVEVDLLRVTEGGPRIYVQAGLPDGSLGLFLVDTGADISVLSREVAERIHLKLDEDGGAVVGLGGITRTDRGTLTSLKFGHASVHGIEVAVGVPGMDTNAGAMPLDGLLGNNVWSRFVLELDYPADQMVLHPPGTFKMPKKDRGEMSFDGSHVFAPLIVTTAADPENAHQIDLRVDTGAGELSFCGRGLGVGQDYSVGLEAIRGLGASATLPFYRNLHMTRRIPLAEVRLAGKAVPITSARWMNFDGTGGCPDDLIGLAGHHLLEGHRVVFDYGEQHMMLGKSRRKPRQVNGHRVLLEQERAAFGDREDRAYVRARLLLGLGEMEPAVDALKTAAAQPDAPAEVPALLAAALREMGDPEAAWALLEALGPEALVEEGEIVAGVNGLLFRGETDAALSLARQAVDVVPDASAGWVALSDAHLHLGEVEDAHHALQRAVDAERHPDAHLLRRARVAMARGDRNASLSHIRKLLQQYPMGGEALWFYALLVDGEQTRETFRSDLERAMSRLHPETRPLDYLVAAHHILGDQQQSEALMEEGIARDCDHVEGFAQDNCMAWYWSLAGVRPDPALLRIRRALTDGDRADYLDTLAMVHLSRGEIAEAHEAAVAAARRAPDNVYMLWQADRLRRLEEEE